MIYNLWSDYNRPMKGEGPFFTDYWANVQSASYPYVGLEYANWDSDRYPYLCEREEILLKRFNERFAYREIGQETAVRFQHFLSMRFDEIAENINHMYSVYAVNDIDNIGVGYSETEEYEWSKDGSYHTDNDSTTDTDSTVTDTGTGGQTNVNTNVINDATNTVVHTGSDSVTYGKTVENIIDESSKSTPEVVTTVEKTGDAKYKDTPYGDSDAWNNPTNQQVEESTSETSYSGSNLDERDGDDFQISSGSDTKNYGSTDKETRTYDATVTDALTRNLSDESTTDYYSTYNNDVDNTHEDSGWYKKSLVRSENDEHIIEEVNTIAEKYKTIDNIFIDCFEPLFISIVAMI